MTNPADKTRSQLSETTPVETVFRRDGRLNGAIAADQRCKEQSPPNEKPPAVKRRRKSPALPAEYRRELARVAREHRKKFGPQFKEDPKLRERGARYYKSLLPRRRPGRPAIDGVSTAIRLLKLHRVRYPDDTPEQHWRRIYPRAIPDYDAMSIGNQRAQRLLLRNRVRARGNQQKRRAKEGMHSDTATSRRQLTASRMP